MTIRDLLAGDNHLVLSSAQRVSWLRLARSHKVGPRLFQNLLERHGNADAALDDLACRIRRDGHGELCSKTQAEDELARTQQLGGSLICQCEPDYPAYLRVIADPPPVLTILGDPAWLHRPAIAIVGARNASLAGMKQARQMAVDLGNAGFAIVSGMARGIDGAAHRGSLATGTIAVIAGGIDVIYPYEHRDLYAEIAAQGAVVCEHAPGTPTQPRLFPRRNRIVSGLSRAVVVVEATKRSGSLITARLAGEQGRDVFAVPGAPRDPRAQGCNSLIRDGSVLAQSAADIIEIIGSPGPGTPRPKATSAPLTPGHIPQHKPERIPEPTSSSDYLADGRLHPDGNPPPNQAGDPSRDTKDTKDTIGNFLSATPMTADDLIRHGTMTPDQVSEILLEMELAGRIYRLPGNRISIT